MSRKFVAFWGALGALVLVGAIGAGPTSGGPPESPPRQVAAHQPAGGIRSNTVQPTQSGQPAQSRPERAAAGKASGTQITAMSFNILTALRHQDDRPWDKRRAAVAKTIVSHGADVLGVQEASITRDWADNDDDIPQWESLRRALARKGYGHALTGSDGRYEDCGRKNCSSDEAKQFGLHIFYKKASLKPVGAGGMVNVDNDWCEWDDRAMVWQFFRTRTTPSSTFLAVDTHLDSEGINERGDFERCRNGQVKNILKAVRTSINPRGLPVVLMGDLNSYAYQKPVKTLLKNGFLDTANSDAPHKNTGFNSFHGFKNPPPRVPGHRIDYIMVTKGIGVRKWELLVKADPRTGRLKGKVPSDHHPLMAVLTVPGPEVKAPEPPPERRLCGTVFPVTRRLSCF